MTNSICLISSSGGHLYEIMQVAAQLRDKNRFYVTSSLPHVKDSLVGEELYYVTDPHVSPFKYILNFIQTLFLYVKKRPKIIITTGAGIALSMCCIGKLCGSKIVFVESGARVHRPSRTARVLYHIADLFIVQWEPLLKCFPKAKYGGVLL